jgi:hypothetical protein
MPDPHKEMTRLEKYLTDEFCKLWRILNAADVELQSYKAAVRQVLSGDPAKVDSLNARIVDLRRSPDLRKRTNEKYSGILGTIVNGLPERPPHTNPVVKALANLDNIVD